MHISLDLYLRALRGEFPMEALERIAHEHLLECCVQCHDEWSALAGTELASFIGWSPTRETPTDPRLVRRSDIAAQKQRLSEKRRVATDARQDLKRLLEFPAPRWEERIRGARTRMRSRAFAELLLVECRDRVRSSPQEAEALAGLVPVALEWAETLGRGWVRPLLALANAYRANALRVAGDLNSAQRVFAGLRTELEFQPLQNSRVGGEIYSLAASLCIDARQFEEAEALLGSSRAAHRAAEDAEGETKTLIQHANLLYALGRLAEALDFYEEAAAKATSQYSVELLCTVTGRVNVLCEMNRPEEAGELLDAHSNLYSWNDDTYDSILLGCLEGRVHLGLGRHDEAARAFEKGRQRLLDIGRNYDAMMASLDLADALRAGHQTKPLRQLAAELVPLFRSRGVTREALAALRLFVEAVQAEQLTVDVLVEARKRVEQSPPTLTGDVERARLW